MLERAPRKNRTEVTFVLPADTPPGPVSVVGDGTPPRMRGCAGGGGSVAVCGPVFPADAGA
ncbi:hypothetical protein C6N75_17995 [Streptomyces solincola]|uniref:Uncharacterized protein n=1 Tax=Streptomyces solincola TaxID=2100817 RepID=A0A2S9PU01_9ACTN|nr:hypothetical protein [Streptomyces solincola]PRH77910.1 hypothetical protein C6N75_17995 [Streptomyces solincola]